MSFELWPWKCVSVSPAIVPTSPKTPQLKTVRMSGRRSRIATIVGAVA